MPLAALAALASTASSAGQIALHSLQFSRAIPKPDTTAPFDVSLPSGTTSQLTEASDNLLVVSPYLTRPHLLDLHGLSKPVQLVSKALTLLQPIRADYATAPYLDSFNWVAVMERLQGLCGAELGYQLESQAFYVIVFRSQIPHSTDRSYLGALDELSHAEAMESGGLLKYWFGLPDEHGRNLATCKSCTQISSVRPINPKIVLTVVGVWRAREDASSGVTGSGHAQAMRETWKLYTEWKVERLKLAVGVNALHWEIIKWQD
jgi:hypothetical protein